ncbi:MAG TPA: T9SS type A sorting domain-containing protein, partial [Bacteroidota bacterium]|nr:T9SS type A sorting domain-containing protein [Bacteroidota bacterium]
CISGPVDASNCLSSLMAPSAAFRVGDDQDSGVVPSTSNGQPFTFSEASEYIQELMNRIEDGPVGDALSAIHTLSGMCGPGGNYATVLSESWEDFLKNISDGGHMPEIQSLARAYMIDARMNGGDFAGTIDLAKTILNQDPDDALWLHAQFQIVAALASMGELDEAETAFHRMKSRGMSINQDAVVRLAEFLSIFNDELSGFSVGKAVTSRVDESLVPSKFALSQNYPNPFNPTTAIEYELPEDAFVSLKVYNALGQEVATLVRGNQDAGYKYIEFDASGLPSGMYIYRLQAGKLAATMKMLLLR